MAAVAPAAGWSVCRVSAWTMGCLSDAAAAGEARSLCVPRELHQSIDGDDALSRRPHDQWVDFRLGDAGIVGELRERDDGVRERAEIARGPAAVAGERNETADLGDHLVRRGDIDRRDAQAAVARDLGEHAG